MNANPDVLTILTDWLAVNGFDGLCREGCGCTVDDLAPGRDCLHETCQAAYRYECTEQKGEELPYEGCLLCCGEPGEASFCMRLEKPEGKTTSRQTLSVSGFGTTKVDSFVGNLLSVAVGGCP